MRFKLTEQNAARWRGLLFAGTSHANCFPNARGPSQPLANPPPGTPSPPPHNAVRPPPDRKTRIETLIVSDVHLGSEVSRARDLLAVLQNHAFRRLILLGDIFSDLNFKRLKREHWEFLSHVRKLSNPKRGVEVVWVEGNHDRGLSDVMSHLVGVEVLDEYVWTYEGRKYMAVHGHQFDLFLFDNQFASGAGALLHRWVQRCDYGQLRLSRSMDRINTSWLRMTPRVAAGALKLATERGADFVFCGHTHEALRREEGGVCYVNTGCWTQSPATYVTVCREGVRLHYYE